MAVVVLLVAVLLVAPTPSVSQSLSNVSIEIDDGGAVNLTDAIDVAIDVANDANSQVDDEIVTQEVCSADVFATRALSMNNSSNPQLQDAVGVQYDDPNWQDALTAYISQAKYETSASNITIDDSMVQPAGFRPVTTIVRTQGPRFTLNGKIWRFAGTNIYGIAAQVCRVVFHGYESDTHRKPSYTHTE